MPKVPRRLHIKDNLVKTLKSIECYVLMSIIAMGLLQIIALNFFVSLVEDENQRHRV